LALPSRLAPTPDFAVFSVPGHLLHSEGFYTSKRLLGQSSASFRDNALHAHMKTNRSYPYPPASQPPVKISQSENWNHRLSRGLPRIGHPQGIQVRVHPQIINCSQVWPQVNNPQKFVSEYKRQHCLYTTCWIQVSRGIGPCPHNYYPKNPISSQNPFKQTHM
jgi:hypothetical protein